jgi:hypothetical protein
VADQTCIRALRGPARLSWVGGEPVDVLTFP